MLKPIQNRTRATRARLIESAQGIIAAKGYGALRVEDVVQTAGVAKGTFFAHFAGKDGLMELMIGAQINAFLDEAETWPAPQTIDDLVSQIVPLIQFMTSERYVFDVILRHSGAAAREEIGPIAQTFTRQVDVVARWLSDSPFRKDISGYLLAEGIQAFSVQAMALHFCAINNSETMEDRPRIYLDAWLNPRLAS